MIALAPLGRDEFDRVAHVTITSEQEPFCGTVALHFDLDEAGCDFHIVTRDGRAVGFFKIDRAYAERFEFAKAPQIGLRGMMIDHAEQGKGTGKAAMELMQAYLAARYPAATACFLTVNVINPAARAIYLAGGFCDNGGLYDGGRIGPQHILKLDLHRIPATCPAETDKD